MDEKHIVWPDGLMKKSFGAMDDIRRPAVSALLYHLILTSMNQLHVLLEAAGGIHDSVSSSDIATTRSRQSERIGVTGDFAGSRIWVTATYLSNHTTA